MTPYNVDNEEIGYGIYDTEIGLNIGIPVVLKVNNYFVDGFVKNHLQESHGIPSHICG